MPGEYHRRGLNRALVDLPAEEQKQIISSGFGHVISQCCRDEKMWRKRTAYEAKTSRSECCNSEEYEDDIDMSC